MINTTKESLFITLALCTTVCCAQRELTYLLQEKQVQLHQVEHYLKEREMQPLDCHEEWTTEVSQKLMNPTVHYRDVQRVFNVYFHVLNENNGQRTVPIDEADILSAVANLNGAFNAYNIFFKYRGYGEINDTYRSVVYLGGTRTFDELVTYAKTEGLYQENSLNIFIAATIRMSQYDTREIAGLANKPGVNVVVNDKYLLSSTLTHEVGHNFFLHHTHANWNSGNCELAHYNDGVEDTPPSVPFNTTDIAGDCHSYLGNLSNDQCGIAIRDIPASNFMSSYNLPCRDLAHAVFTEGQANRMHTAIEAYPDVFEPVKTTLASLYQPYTGNYTAGTTETIKFQKGFDYEFVSCSDNSSVKQRFGKEETPVGHPYNTAVKILQVSATTTMNCRTAPTDSFQGGEVISYGVLLNGMYKVKKLNALDVASQRYLQELPTGYNRITITYKNGQRESELCFKQNK